MILYIKLQTKPFSAMTTTLVITQLLWLYGNSVLRWIKTLVATLTDKGSLTDAAKKRYRKTWSELEEAYKDKSEALLILSKTLNAISHPTSLHILNRIAEKGKSSYTDLLDYAEIDDASLAYHLEKLKKVHIIVDTEEPEMATGRRTSYTLTEYGKLLLSYLSPLLREIEYESKRK